MLPHRWHEEYARRIPNLMLRTNDSCSATKRLMVRTNPRCSHGTDGARILPRPRRILKRWRLPRPCLRGCELEASSGGSPVPFPGLLKPPSPCVTNGRGQCGDVKGMPSHTAHTIGWKAWLHAHHDWTTGARAEKPVVDESTDSEDNTRSIDDDSDGGDHSQRSGAQHSTRFAG